MESLVLPIVAMVLALPIIAITALVRTFSLRGAFNQSDLEYQETISDLRREIASLRYLLTDVSLRVGQRNPASSPSPSAKVSAPERPPTVVAVEVPSPFPVAAASELIKPEVQGDAVTQPYVAPESAVPFIAPEVIGEAPRSANFVSASLEPASSFVRTAEPPAQAIPPQQPKRQTDTAGSSAAPSFTAFEPAPTRKGFVQKLRDIVPLEDVLGMNLFAKIGIVLLVLGFALLGRVALVAMGPGGKVALFYTVAATLLGGGMWFERKERYRLIGRTGIGGGWAMFFFTTYAMHHVAAMQVMSSNVLNSVLLLAVSGAMVTHTLRYRSQLVTGLAFLLAFSTVALTQNTVYALAAGVILALGIVTIALRIRRADSSLPSHLLCQSLSDFAAGRSGEPPHLHGRTHRSYQLRRMGAIAVGQRQPRWGTPVGRQSCCLVRHRINHGAALFPDRS